MDRRTEILIKSFYHGDYFKKKEGVRTNHKCSNRIKSCLKLKSSCKEAINTHTGVVLLHHRIHCSTKGSVLLHYFVFQKQKKESIKQDLRMRRWKDYSDLCKEGSEGTMFLFGSIYWEATWFHTTNKNYVWNRCNPPPSHSTGYRPLQKWVGMRLRT